MEHWLQGLNGVDGPVLKCFEKCTSCLYSYNLLWYRNLAHAKCLPDLTCLTTVLPSPPSLALLLAASANTICVIL